MSDKNEETVSASLPDPKLSLPHGTTRSAALSVKDILSALVVKIKGSLMIVISLQDGGSETVSYSDENVACLTGLGIYVGYDDSGNTPPKGISKPFRM